MKITFPFWKNSEEFIHWKKTHRGDLLGGLTGAAVALPQSMALGVVLFTTLGLDIASGALAGLLGMIILSLCSGIAGATSGMISAPNGPVTILLATSLLDINVSGTELSAILFALVVILVMAGLIQILLGLTFGGYLVKYIPFPVITGLVTSIGVLMIISQIKSLTGAQLDEVEGLYKAIPFLVALITLASIHLCARFWPKVPGILSGLAIGIACYHLLVIFIPGSAPNSWVVGSIPTFEGFIALPNLTQLQKLPWLKLITVALAVALLAAVDCLLTAVVADGQTGMRHNTRKELVAQGFGQIITGLLGAVGGGGTKGSTLIAIQSGGRRWAAVVCALFVLLILFFAGTAGLVLPISVLAGVIAYVGLNMIDINIFSWAQRRRLRVDAAVTFAVILSTLTYDLFVGLGVGLVGSMLLYIRSQVRVPVLHGKATGKNHRSLKDRSDEEHDLLKIHGERIVYVELRGNLFFGTADRLFNELLSDLDRSIWMVINMRRVQHIDSSAVHLLGQMATRLQQNGGTMVYTNVIKTSGGFKKINKAFSALGTLNELEKVKTFSSTDAALQFAEDSLLTDLGYKEHLKLPKTKLDENRLCENLTKSSIKALAKLLEPVSIAQKKILFKQGDEGDSIFLIIKGEVEIRLPIGRYHYKCTSKRGPGNYFGSTAFLRPGVRSTTCVTTQACELLELNRSSLNTLLKQGKDETVVHILESVSRTVARQLRWSRMELTRLEKA